MLIVLIIVVWLALDALGVMALHFNAKAHQSQFPKKNLHW